ncbi:ABC transporter ATP-binding protein [Streptococcus halichoeri]|uniref:ABC transporter ATP-binding protein n=1 Tax=Streptococcus halichoeri TaxID=254785 RepID=UPI001E332E71|nr:ABC transporter ATP-binding protein [Streptococcus halichoeri]
MNQLELIDITKGFKDGEGYQLVLDHLTLTVAAGEFVAILGPSGSGKSTLLSIAGLLLSPDAGHLKIAGQDMTGLKQTEWTKKRQALLGFIFQDHQLLPFMTIEQQLALVAKVKGVKKADIAKTVEQLLGDLGMADSAKKHPNQLSGGQKQRVAIARAFLGNSQVILADEPTASLDPERGRDIVALIQKEVKEKQKAAIMVTHDRSVLDFVDTVYELKQGQLQKFS